MTHIDFYILANIEQQARLHFACRLIEKAQRLGNRVFVACDSIAEAEAFDTLLWTFNPESFVPHSLLNADKSAGKNDPVEIGLADNCGEHQQLLVNLCAKLPDYFSRFERACEIVVQNEQVLAQTRKNYAFLKQRGYPIKSHTIKS